MAIEVDDIIFIYIYIYICVVKCDEFTNLVELQEFTNLKIAEIKPTMGITPHIYIHTCMYVSIIAVTSRCEVNIIHPDKYHVCWGLISLYLFLLEVEPPKKIWNCK